MKKCKKCDGEGYVEKTLHNKKVLVNCNHCNPRGINKMLKSKKIGIY